ncbi:hypothetical protein PO909_013859 [Leuciscus waleckii]
MAPPTPCRPIVPSERGDLSLTPRQGGSLGLARERTNLSALVLSPCVIATIQNARAVFTRSLYGFIRRTVPEWDLSMVLEALSQYPFEPLKLLSFKAALLLALASAKRVGECLALSLILLSCLNASLRSHRRC